MKPNLGPKEARKIAARIRALLGAPRECNRFGWDACETFASAPRPHCSRCETGIITRTAGYYAWRERPESTRATSNSALLAEIQQVHRESGERYGSPRVHALLRTQGRGASRGRIERLMRRHGIRAIMAPPRRVRTTVSSESADRAEPDRTRLHRRSLGPSSILSPAHAGGRSTERRGPEYKLRSGLQRRRQVSPPHKRARLR